jgi:hypothetical protein
MCQAFRTAAPLAIFLPQEAAVRGESPRWLALGLMIELDCLAVKNLTA